MERSEKSSTVQQRGFSARWTSLVFKFRKPFEVSIKQIAVTSATYPKVTIALVVLISCGILALGLLTNFRIEVDEGVLWTPKGSYPSAHSKWIDNESGFPISPRRMTVLFHQDGDGKISKEYVRRVFTALDAIRTLPNYSTACQRRDAEDCQVVGITNFWNNTASLAESNIASDEEVAITLSESAFPDGTPTSGTLFLGKAVYDEDGLLTETQSISLVILIPEDGANETISYDFEREAIDAILALDETWTDESTFRVEIFADRSFSDEFGRSIAEDIPLVPIVFAIMGAFTSAVFFKRDRVRSRSFLGLMAVVSVLLSIMAGYGLMFSIGVPFTSITQILLFVFFGVGLDDAFIITGSYFRLDPSRDPIERVKETMDDIGISIFLTTLTSSIAFALGGISTIPGVLWLVLYAVPTIILILLWQLTFFIACLSLDERRIQAENRDCLRCVRCAPREGGATEQNVDSHADRFMEGYARILLNPIIKLIVIVGFIALAVLCGISTAKLEQAFAFTDVLPSDSYITSFFTALGDYSGATAVIPFIYFRDVDQSDIEIRQQMDTYVNDLATVDAIGTQPEQCWFRDFDTFIVESDLSDESFAVQMGAFLDNDVFKKVYEESLVFDASGNITASRCRVSMDNFDVDSVKSQTDGFLQQQNASLSQPANAGVEELKFFTYDVQYNIWAFYVKSAGEIIYTTVGGIAAVTVVAIFLVPHWTAAFFVLPFIALLYNDLLGVMQWAGISINPVSYITLVMSIGLLVDFILHIIVRFYEVPGTREEKVVAMLKSMGSSILVGGITTFLGTLPLAFSVSDIFTTFFVSFVAIVTLGVGHGLVLLPVVLSIVGPEDIGGNHQLPSRASSTEIVAKPNPVQVVVTKDGGFEFPGLELEYYNEASA